MQLFRRRPLCFLCFLFALLCLLGIRISSDVKIYGCIGALCALVVLIVCIVTIKKARRVLVFCALALVFSGGALLSSYIGIDLSQKRAEEYIGEHAVKLTVLREEYTSEYSSAYTVRVESVDNERASVKAVFIENFENDIYVGDTVYLNAELLPADAKVFGINAANLVNDADVLLCCIADSSDSGFIEHFDRSAPIYKQLLAKNGPRVLFSDLSNLIKHRATALLGDKAGALAYGFLVGDTSDISDITLKDFRRAGVSHILAVSGMHISIMIAVIEFLFKRLFIPKGVRYTFVCMLAFVLLCLTGFSMSAMRAVLMLWIYYILFAISEESDAPSVLFLALFTMLLLMPYSVYDVGMWMSFFATLGLVTVFPALNQAIPKVKCKKGFGRVALSALRATAITVLITAVANMFLIYIMCTVFGEVSISAIPANVILSPLSTLFMILCVVALSIGFIPFVGYAICVACGFIGEAIVWISSVFSRLEWSVVSLRPIYAKIIVIAFSITLAVLLVIKVKKRWLFAVIPTAFAVVFGVCFAIRAISFEPYAVYSCQYGEETICVIDGTDASVVDMSDGSYEHYTEAMNVAYHSGATEIDSIIFTQITTRHISSMEYIFKNKTVRTVYIPMPSEPQEVSLYLDLAYLARDCGVGVQIYSDEIIELVGGVYFSADASANSFAIAKEEYMLAYCDVSAEGADRFASTYIKRANSVIFSADEKKYDAYAYDTADGASVIYSSSEVFSAQSADMDLENSYVNIYDKLKMKIKLK